MKYILSFLCAYILISVTVSGQTVYANMEIFDATITPSPLGSVEDNGTGVYSFKIRNNGPGVAGIFPRPGELGLSLNYLELLDDVNTDNSNTSIHGYEEYYDIYVYIFDTRQVHFLQKAEIPPGTTITISLDVKVIQNSTQQVPLNRGGVNYSAGTNHLIADEDGYTIARTYTTAAAPVELVDFEVAKNGEFSILNWNTVSEINNDYFEIERSQDGVEFVKIGVVEGHGNTQESQSYHFVDESPLKGINYYRLKQVDYDESIDYSKVLFLNFDELFGGDELTFKMYPNPSSQYLNIVSNKDLNHYSVKLFDVLGRQLRTMPYVSGMVLPMYDLQSGLYSIHVIDKFGSLVKKELIIHQSN